MGTFGAPLGLFLAAYLFGICLAAKYAVHRQSGRSKVLLGFVLLFPVVIGLLLHAVSRTTAHTWKAVCRNQMKQLAFAMYNYHDTYGTYPPACTTDKTGQPMHSWRTMLLPYLEDDALYKQVDLTTTWNSQTNKQLSSHAAYCFQCGTAERTGRSGTTDYVAVVGEGTMWSTEGSRHIADPANTIMFIEIADSDIQWAEPRDLTLSEVLDPRGEKNRPLASHHEVYAGTPFTHPVPSTFRVATANGSVYEFSSRPSREELIALFDPGPKSIDIAAIANRPSRPRLRWSGILGLIIMVASYVGICCARLWPVQERYDRQDEESFRGQQSGSP